MRTVVLDNEAVGALADALHPKHRAVLAHINGVVARRRREASIVVVVPTSVRVEAGWDRSDPRAAGINRLRIADAALDRSASDAAARIARGTGVGVIDAHVGAVVQSVSAQSDEVVVLTSDPHDIARAAAPVKFVTVRV